MPLILAAIPLELVVAFAILLILYAWQSVIAPPLVQALSELPLIGGALADRINNATTRIVGWAQQFAKSSLDALIQIVAVPAQWFTSVLTGVVNLGEGIVANLTTLFAGLAGLGQAVSAAVSLLLDRIAAVAKVVAGLAGTVLAAAEATAHALVAAAVSALTSALDTAVHNLSLSIAENRAQTTAALDKIDGKVGGLIATTPAAIAAAAAALRAEWASDLKPLEGAIDHVTDIAAPIVAAGLTVGAVTTLVEDLIPEAECIAGMCSALSKTLPILNILGDLATLGIVGLVVGEAIRDPEGTAKEVAGVVEGVEGVARGLIGEFAGVNL